MSERSHEDVETIARQELAMELALLLIDGNNDDLGTSAKWIPGRGERRKVEPVTDSQRKRLAALVIRRGMGRDL